MLRFGSFGRKFLSDQVGVALIEFILVMPLLIALVIGGVEYGRYMLITQKVEKSGYVMNDILTQYSAADLADPNTIDGLFKQFGVIMTPYGADVNQRVIYTSVTKDPADNLVKIDWQKSGGGTLTNQAVSIVDGLNAGDINGSNPPAHAVATFQGNAAILAQLQPGKTTGMAPNEEMIVAEVYYQYKPLTAHLLQAVGITVKPAVVTRRTFMRPRQGDLILNCDAGTDGWGQNSDMGNCSGSYPIMKAGDIFPMQNAATGYTGSETAHCEGGQVTFTDMACTQSPQDGACGPANGGTFQNASDVNAAGLCSAGVAQPAEVVDPGPWNWRCKGQAGGADANCAAQANCSQRSWVYVETDDFWCNPPFHPYPNPCTGSCDQSQHVCKWQISCNLVKVYNCECAH